jgi:hypothetical protein
MANETIEISKLKNQNYLLLYPAINLQGGALINVKYGGRSDVLIETLSDAMLSEEGLALVVMYAAKEYERKKFEQDHKRKKAAAKKAAKLQLEMF